MFNDLILLMLENLHFKSGTDLEENYINFAYVRGVHRNQNPTFQQLMCGISFILAASVQMILGIVLHGNTRQYKLCPAAETQKLTKQMELSGFPLKHEQHFID